jgi:hypothetical protein
VVVTRDKGEGGTQGFLEWLALYYPTAFAAMLGKVIPIQVNMRKSSDHSHTVEIKYPSLEDARRRCVTAVSTRPSIEAARKPKFITQQN